MTVGGSSLHPTDGGQAVYQVVPGTSGITWLADADLSQTKTGVRTEGRFRQRRLDDPRHGRHLDHGDERTRRHSRLVAQTGWTFPTQNDLAGLYQALRLSGQEPVVPVPDTTLHGFQDIQPYLYWSCAGSSIVGSCSGVASAPPGRAARAPPSNGTSRSAMASKAPPTSTARCTRWSTTPTLRRRRPSHQSLRASQRNPARRPPAPSFRRRCRARSTAR